MDIFRLLCLSLVLILNAVFDAFILVARATDTLHPLFGDKVSTEGNMVHGALFLGPVVELIGAAMCWSIYRDHIGNLMGEDELMGVEDGSLAPLGHGSTEKRASFEAF